MKTLYKFLVVSACVLCTAGKTMMNSILVHDMCFTDSKHCIKCFQNNSDTSYENLFSPEEYRISIMDQLNRVRSQYAEAHRISNMKFTNWIKEIEALADSLARIPTIVTKCNVSSAANSIDRINNYQILDFHAHIELVDHTKNLNKLLHLQLENFTRQMVNTVVMMAWNLNEFGCGYTFNNHGRNLTMLLRCVLYNEMRRRTIELKSSKMCLDCERTSERCIDMDRYRGLCVPNAFNETRLRWYIESEQTNNTLWSWILIWATILVFMIFIVFPVLYKVMFDPKKTQTKQFLIYNQAPSAPPTI